MERQRYDHIHLAKPTVLQLKTMQRRPDLKKRYKKQASGVTGLKVTCEMCFCLFRGLSSQHPDPASVPSQSTCQPTSYLCLA